MIQSSNDEYVYVPIPPRLLPAFYQWFATAMEENSEEKRVPAPTPNVPKRKDNIIDLSVDAARAIGADHHPVSLSDLHAAYLRANPGISKGTTLDGFGATIGYYTINMKSRFFYPNDKKKSAPWLKEPKFKRVAYGQYKLLSPDEERLFKQRVDEDDERIYQDQYDIDDLR